MQSIITEPKEAFLYKAPDQETKEKYADIFSIKQPIKTPFLKMLFDKILAIIILVACLPVILMLFLAYKIEGLILPENRGPLFFYYNAVSQGKVFKKYKIRLIKEKYIDKELQAKGDWHAYSKEWTPESRTYVGRFVKKFYLDEIPQFWCVLKGDMSIVGPRPLAVHHYERDLAQGNVTRFLIKGGLLGLGHIMKGTTEMGNPVYEYEYIRRYIHSSSFRLLMLDFKIIWRGIALMLKGQGL
jgi:lipopolysaccharide/colanic/teichoic acid biosynthesis glycosyltransferase